MVDGVSTTVYVLVLLAALAVAVGSDGLLRWAAVAVVAAVAVAVSTRSGPTRIGLLLALVAAGTSPWNAFAFGGLRPADLSLVAAVGLLLLSRRGLGALPNLVLPGWLLVLTVTVAVLMAGHELFPTDAAFLAQRVQVDAAGLTTTGIFTNVGIGGRWLVSLLGVPVLCVLVRQHGGVWLARLALAFVGGAAVSGLVAVTDGLGLTAISGHFVVPDSGGRQAGLTVHPNHLAATACLAVPFVFWAFARPGRRVHVYAAACLVLLLASVYESGSRGGAVCVVLAAALTLVLVKRLRSRLPLVVGAAFLAMFVVFGFYPDALAHLLTSVRLSGSGGGVDASDQVRATLQTQGIADFRHAPFVGVGLQVGLDAHNIFRQMLAAGGIALFSAFVVFAVGAFRSALRVGRVHPLAYAAAASVASWLLFGMVENLLLDRFLYFPAGFIVAMMQRTEVTGASPAPAPAPAPDPAPDPVPAGRP